MHVGRLQWITAIVMAYAVMMILVSPAVPSPATTLRTKQTIQPPQFIAPVSALLFTSVVDLAGIPSLLDAEHSAIFNTGSEVIDLTTARLC